VSFSPSFGAYAPPLVPKHPAYRSGRPVSSGTPKDRPAAAEEAQGLAYASAHPHRAKYRRASPAECGLTERRRPEARAESRSETPRQLRALPLRPAQGEPCNPRREDGTTRLFFSELTAPDARAESGFSGVNGRVNPLKGYNIKKVIFACARVVITRAPAGPGRSQF